MEGEGAQRNKRAELFQSDSDMGLGESNGQNPPLLDDPGRSINQGAPSTALTLLANVGSLHIMHIFTMPIPSWN